MLGCLIRFRQMSGGEKYYHIFLFIIHYTAMSSSTYNDYYQSGTIRLVAKIAVGCTDEV